MSEPTTIGAVSSEEREKRIQAAILAKIEARVKAAEDKMLEGVADMIGAAELPIRTGVEYTNRKGETVHRQTSPTEGLYRYMSPEERAIRNPDSDHWMAEFWRGVRDNDKVQMGVARDKLDAMFPSRADLLEGAAPTGTTGAFSDGTGGYYLPRPLEQLVAVARDRTAKLWRYATTYRMTAQEHNIPTGAAMTAYMQAEATTPTTTGFTTAQVPLIAYNGIAKAIVGNDMLADTAVNLVSFITQRAGAALGVLEDAQFFKDGTGSSPNVTKISGTTTTYTTTTILAYTDLLKHFTNLQQEYRENARWFVASDVLGFMAGVRDGQGRPFYASLLDPPMAIADTPSGAPAQGAVGTLLGKFVHEVPFTPGTIWFGDPAATYAIGRREGITVEVSREFLFDTRRTMFLIRQRFGGNNIETVSAQIHTGITSATSL